MSRGLQVAEGRVAVLGAGPLAAAVREVLARTGLRCTGVPPGDGSPGPVPAPEGPPFGALETAALAVVAPDPEEPEALERWNAHALRRRVPWFPVRVDGLTVRLGPFVRPGETACHACAERRIAANLPGAENRRAARRALGDDGSVPPAPGGLRPAVARLAAELCALEAVGFFGGEGSPPWGRIVEHSLSARRVSVHRVLPLPLCPACDPEDGHRSTVRAWTAPRGGARRGPPWEGPEADGVERVPDPAVCDPLTGIVRRCFELPSVQDGVGDGPRVVCCGAEATATGRLGTSLPDCGRYGAAAALTRTAALAAATGEVLERYSATIYREESLRRAAFEELDEEAVAPERFVLFSEAQYRAFRAEAAAGRRRWAPEPFTAGTPTAWVPGFDLSRRRPVLVPAPFVYLPYRYAPGEPFVTDCHSTGLACARRLDDAVLRGLYEVVERDALSILWHASLAVPRIALDREDALGAFYRERLACRGVRCELLDATLDVGIPTVVAVLLHPRGGLVVGSAARLDPLEAARKALLEAAQAWIVRRRDLEEGSRPDDAEAGAGEGELQILTFADHQTLYTRPGMGREAELLWSSPDVVEPADLPRRATGDLRGDLAVSLDLLAARGLEAVALDLTPRDVAGAGYRVARVVVPGMERLNARHDAPFWGGRRLREVPRTLGLAARALGEDELNRGVHPFP